MVQQKDWESAQILEKCYQQLPKKRLKSKPSLFLNREFNLETAFFHGKFVLEIGVALSGSIHDIEGASLKVGLDPLAKYYASVYPKSAEHIQGRGEELPFKDRCLDTVICINTIDHTEKPNVALQQMRRCLKEDGLLLFSVNTFIMPKFLRQTILSGIDRVHPQHFSGQEIRLMLKDAGFEVIYCFHKKHSFENRLSYFRWLVRNNRIGSMLKYLVAKTLFGLQELWIKCK